MNVTKKLMDEHQLILNYIDLLESYLEVIRAKREKTYFEKLPDFVDFIQNYADKYHHAKEENILFKYMEEPGVLTHCNPLPVMLHDHEEGRAYVREVLKGVKENNYEIATENAYNWAELLREHIYKEDNILYAMAENGLGDAQKQMIESDYRKVEEEMNGDKLTKKYEELYRSLEKLIK